MRNIRISENLWQFLKKHAEPFEETPGDVIERLLGISTKAESIPETHTASGRTKQEAFRPAILEALRHLGGRATKADVLTKIPEVIDLTEADLSEDKNGGVLWRYRAVWEASNMRKERLLLSPTRGIWQLPPAA